MKKIISAVLALCIIGGTLPIIEIYAPKKASIVYADDVVGENAIDQEEDKIVRTETWTQDLPIITKVIGELKYEEDYIKDCIFYSLNIYESSKMELCINLSRDIALPLNYSTFKIYKDDGGWNVEAKGYTETSSTRYLNKSYTTTIIYIPYYNWFVNYGTVDYYKYWDDPKTNLLPPDFVCDDNVLKGFESLSMRIGVKNAQSNGSVNWNTVNTDYGIRYVGEYGNDVTNAFFGPNEIKYTFVPTRTLKDTEYEFRLFGHEFTYNPNNSNNNIEPTNEPETDTNYIDRIKSLEEENAKLKEENERLKSGLNISASNYGDINGDNVIDGRDATLLLTYYAKTSTGYEGTLAEFVASSNETDTTNNNNTE